MSKFKQFLTNPAFQSEEDKYFEDQAIFLLQKQKLERIDNFNGYFDFLNNEYPCQIYQEGIYYKSVAHAYQAARSQFQYIKEKIAYADTLAELYEIAAEIDDPPQWQATRIRVMESCLRDKFRRNRDLMSKLKETGNRELVNSYADCSVSNLFWGVCEGKGQNQLGRLLMTIRFDLFGQTDLEKWIYMVHPLVTESVLLPVLSLQVNKAQHPSSTINLPRQDYHLLGSLQTSHVVMAHQSISRKHFILFQSPTQGVCGMDVGSKGGSFVDGKRIESHVPIPLKSGITLHFALSTRKYILQVDYSKVYSHLKAQKHSLLNNIAYLQHPPSTRPQLLAQLGPILQNTLFISNLSPLVTYSQLNELFKPFGRIKEIRLPIDRRTGRPRGIGFVVFEEAEDAQKALQLDKSEFLKNRIYVNLTHNKSHEQEYTSTRHSRSRSRTRHKHRHSSKHRHHRNHS